jgi:hypothetical protein
VWRVSDDRGNLDRIVAALASARGGLFNLDYAIFDAGRLELRMEQSEGETLDREANHAWHYDLVELTVSGVAELTQAIRRGERHRCSAPNVGRLLADAVTAGRIDRTLLREDLRAKVERLLPHS